MYSFFQDTTTNHIITVKHQTDLIEVHHIDLYGGRAATDQYTAHEARSLATVLIRAADHAEGRGS